MGHGPGTVALVRVCWCVGVLGVLRLCLCSCCPLSALSARRDAGMGDKCRIGGLAGGARGHGSIAGSLLCLLPMACACLYYASCM
jgi:hypothetical protein